MDKYFQVLARGYKIKRPRSRTKSEIGINKAKQRSSPSETKENPSAFEINEN